MDRDPRSEGKKSNASVRVLNYRPVGALGIHSPACVRIDCADMFVCGRSPKVNDVQRLVVTYFTIVKVKPMNLCSVGYDLYPFPPHDTPIIIINNGAGLYYTRYVA